MLNMYDWYFVPVHNPDGYDYAMNVVSVDTLIKLISFAPFLYYCNFYDWYFVPVHNPDGYDYAMNVVSVDTLIKLISFAPFLYYL